MLGQTVLCCALALFTTFSMAEDLSPFTFITETDDSSQRDRVSEEVREEFDQTYPLAATGRVNLENINGRVSISVWERNEVRVRATKRAGMRERLAEARIAIERDADNIQIKTEYPSGENRDVASVEYYLTVPRQVRLDRIAVINGDLQIENVTGMVHASTINGALTARQVNGDARLSTVNGSIEATFAELREDSETAVDSVNGAITLTLPSDTNAIIRARVLQGSISSDFNIPVRRGRYFGSSVAARLGAGAARINLNSVHGAITLRRAADNRSLSPVTNLQPQSSEENELEAEIDRTVERETARGAREAAREAARLQREAARTVERITEREIERTVSEAMREVERSMDDLRENLPRGVSRGGRIVEREQRSFSVTGVPRIRLETFDGSISVRVWDRNEVGVMVAKSGSDQEQISAVRVTTQQRGNEIAIIAARNRLPATRGAEQMNSFAAADIEINVPRAANIQATTSDGRISIDGVAGELILTSADGSLQVTGGGGRVRAVTSDGQIRITNFAGEADARTADGSIALDGNFTALTAQTEDGAITLALPREANATIETRAESVINDEVATPENANEGERVRRWRVGIGGEATFRLRTGDGHIILRHSN